MRVAVFVPSPDFPEPWRWAFDAEAKALRDSGIAVDAVPWTDARQLEKFDLIMPLVAWGYHLRFAQWRALLDRLEEEGLPVFNPPALLRWNSDKAYLAELGALGIAIPSLQFERLEQSHLRQAQEIFGSEELVIKPRVSAGATGTFKIRPGEDIPEKVRALPMIVQPMLPSVRTEGEYSLILFDGKLSHAVVKTPASGDFRVQPHLGGTTRSCAPPEGGEGLALEALAAAPAEALYARVDMLRDRDDVLRIIELELVEPALFLDQVPQAAPRFAESVRGAVDRLAQQPLA